MNVSIVELNAFSKSVREHTLMEVLEKLTQLTEQERRQFGTPNPGLKVAHNLIMEMLMEVDHA